MDLRLLRIAYGIEFLLALIAVFPFWAQVGGQAHLDLMPWYWKAALSTGFAVACVKTTAAAVESEQAWNARTWKYMLLVLAFVIAGGFLTYYYHLSEPADEQEEDGTTVNSFGGEVLRVPSMESVFKFPERSRLNLATLCPLGPREFGTCDIPLTPVYQGGTLKTSIIPTEEEKS